MTEVLESDELSSMPELMAKDDLNDDMLPKSTVSKIVERERLKAFEKGRKEAIMEQQQNQMQDEQQIQPPEMIQRQSQGIGGMAPQLSREDIEQMIMSKAPEALMHQFNEHKQKTLVDAFVNKMQAAEQRYPGLGDKLNQLNYNDPAMHSLIEMSNGLENTGDVINELVSNPQKMIQVLAGIRDQPYLGRESLNSLSNSIKQNQAAEIENSQAREPMSKIKPSHNVGLSDNSQLSVNDLRKILSSRK